MERIMGTPKSLSCNELLHLFFSRGMRVDGVDNHKIQHINYYKLKEFAEPFATYSEDGMINYNCIHFSTVLKRYYQDKNLRVALIHAIEKIEISIKTNLARILGERYGAFGYLNFAQWANRSKATRYIIEKKQYRIKEELQNSLKRSDYISSQSKDNFDVDNFPSIWLAIDLLTFGSVVKMIEILSEKNLTQLASTYNCSNLELVSWLKCLHFIRNICAHNSNLIDIKLKTKPKIRSVWKEQLFYDEKGGQEKPINGASIVILIVMELVKMINSKYNWSRIQKVISSICSNDEEAQLFGFKNKKSVDLLS